jgi:methionyl-tRNA formyltransferase
VSALRVAFAGTPEFACTALQAVLHSQHRVTGVFTRPDTPRGRGRQIAASPVKVAALAANLPLSQPQTLKAGAGLPELLEWRADVLVVVAYGLILPQAMLDTPLLGSINIHASLLPRWRGAAPIQRALLAGDARTGITIMRMEAGLDTGPILLQRPIDISPADTSGSLQGELAQLGAKTLLEALDGLGSGALRAVAQPEEGVSYAAKVSKSEALIDWRRTVREIDRQVRAFNPWPIAETRFAGAQLRVLSARIDDSGAGAAVPPGTIVAVSGESVVVQCGEGRLGLTQVQCPGRRPVPAPDFARSRALLDERLG